MQDREACVHTRLGLLNKPGGTAVCKGRPTAVRVRKATERDRSTTLRCQRSRDVGPAGFVGARVRAGQLCATRTSPAVLCAEIVASAPGSSATPTSTEPAVVPASTRYTGPIGTSTPTSPAVDSATTAEGGAAKVRSTSPAVLCADTCGPARPEPVTPPEAVRSSCAPVRL